MFHVRLEQAAAAYNDEDKPTIEFEVGNPRVELLTGRLRLFRSLETTNDESKDESDDAAGSLSWLPISRDTILSLDLTLLGFVSLPMHMGPLELIEFSKAFRSDIVLIRFLRDADPRPSSRMALMQFSTANKAAQFYEAFNGSLFNSMEPERCRLVFVHKIEFIREQLVQSPPLAVNGHPVAQGMLPSFATDDRRDAPEGHVEIPTCPVCLDRLDSSASGILTTLCNHTFHCDCLFRWEGFNCPVCRYSHGDIVSACEVCNTTDHLWICLLCGHIGCGRYSNEHAKKHYQETLHTYSLELETQRVWDYAGDGYVHRLIMNKQDGKFVEFPDPNGALGNRGEDEHMKLEKLASEYNLLLTSQLEEQRLFYERRLSQLNETEHRRAVSMLEQEKKALKKLNENLIKETTKLNEDLHFARELNKSLIDNQQQWKERVLAAEEKVATMETDTQRRVDDLESQIRDLMFYLDTQSRVENSIHKREIQGGQVLVQEARADEKAKPRKSSKKR
ncbi:hypothetical protein H310_06314 [Aphanomyces invadans]|uniref:BRCA1-associated protein n=1 Tax=Aphanomyces invadans TaxID=157072 RepID=A0A024U7W5_9STRA|nr:hypothetical protein H310_06314 [Aphanomyces invadans]ETW01698.1 hypothetical protein H310_06314 [Aphanomyces invadans]|eukprot:XP_008869546.1 hypothetical protein H310_06314 [Aphanomyces invadans]